MDLYALWMPDNPGPKKPPKKGPARYLEVFWDNLGKLLLMNLLCFAGFLPLALLVSLGLILENFWIALLGGVIGGAIAGPAWTASLVLCLACFRRQPERWFALWRQAWKRSGRPAALQGAALGGISGAVLFTGSFFLALLEQGALPALAVWMILFLDFTLLAAAAALLFPTLCAAEPSPFRSRAGEGLALLFLDLGRGAGAIFGLLLWGFLWIALFPVSVPFAAVIGFWPAALLEAQLLGPALGRQYDLDSALPDLTEPGDDSRLTIGQNVEIWWRRYWPLALGLAAAASLALGFVQVALSTVEPDLQIAVVHAEALPDPVLAALEDSLGSLVEDRNGDGAVKVLVNDYVLRFDGGSGNNSDLQAAGATRLVADLSAGDSVLLVVEDPEGFLEWYGDRVETDGARLWKNCPALAALAAGSYTTAEQIDQDLTGQALLAGYTVFPALDCPEDVLSLTQ